MFFIINKTNMLLYANTILHFTIPRGITFILQQLFCSESICNGISSLIILSLVTKNCGLPSHWKE